MPPKTPNGNPEDESFQKSPQEVIADQLPEAPKPETFGQKVTIWVFRCLLVLILGGSIPVGTGAVSFGVKMAELRTASKRKETAVKLRQRQLQLKLLNQIIEVAKTADFNDPISLYRLGLIAHMVNENRTVFGIRLVEAEQTMKLMFSRLSPISGLRQRLSEADDLIVQLTKRVALAKENEESTWKKLVAMRKELDDPKLPFWKKRRLLRNIANTQQDFIQERTANTFYTAQLLREQRLKVYFQEELKKQSQVLKTILKEAATMRSRLQDTATAMKLLIDGLKNRQAPEETIEENVSRLSRLLDRAVIDVAHLSQLDQQTIKRLRETMVGKHKEIRKILGELEVCRKNQERKSSEPAAAPVRVKNPTRVKIRRRPAAMSVGLRKVPVKAIKKVHLGKVFSPKNLRSPMSIMPQMRMPRLKRRYGVVSGELE